MDIKYVVSVKQVVNTANTGQEPKITETNLVDFTGGPDEASAVLGALAERVKKGKKTVGFATFVKAVTDQIEEHDKKAKEKGEPTLAESFSGLLGEKKTPGSKTTR
jgi:crotonobetainyl-CoA:carnitine CoA-transferase CaiB-like acyl-CoA transferase